MKYTRRAPNGQARVRMRVRWSSPSLEWHNKKCEMNLESEAATGRVSRAWLAVGFEVPFAYSVEFLTLPTICNYEGRNEGEKNVDAV